jgi:hypothetical protein
MSSFDVSFEGGEELDAKLRRTVAAIEPAKLERALLPIAQGFAVKLRNVLPKGPTGNLRRAVYAHIPRRGIGRPLPAASAGITARIAPHRHLVEYGTTERYTKSGAYRGIMPKGLYLTEAFRQEQGNMQAQLSEAVRRLVDEAL